MHDDSPSKESAFLTEYLKEIKQEPRIQHTHNNPDHHQNIGQLVSKFHFGGDYDDQDPVICTGTGVSTLR